MKTLTALTAAAALIAGISIANLANAQNPAGAAPQVSSPSNLNKGSDTGPTPQSGAESKSTARSGMKRAAMTGKSRYCMSGARGSNSWNCKFASMASCKKAEKSMGRNCRTNPRMASSGTKASTTGMKSGSKSKSKY